MTYLLRRVKHYAHETGPEDERDGPAGHVRPSFLALGLRADLLHDWLAFVEGRSFDSPAPVSFGRDLDVLGVSGITLLVTDSSLSVYLDAARLEWIGTAQIVDH